MSSQSDKKVARNMYWMGTAFAVLTVALITLATSVAQSIPAA